MYTVNRAVTYDSGQETCPEVAEFYNCWIPGFQ